MDQRTRRSPARFAAPLALIAVLFTFLAIVAGSGGGDEGGESPRSGGDTQAETTTSTSGRSSDRTETEASESDRGPRTYRVQVGDTLGGIADKTGVPLERIEELNPDVDPQAMTAGQRIKLR